MDKTKIIASAAAANTGDSYTTRVLVRERELIADEPKEVGGNDEGAFPGEYLCTALASCKAITLRMYANRKGWAVGEIHVTVDMVKGSYMPSGITTFFCAINFTGALTLEQEKRLLEIAKVCPIDRLLSKPNDIVTIIS